MSVITAEEISPRHGQPAGIVSRGAAALVDFGVVWVISGAITLSLNLVQSVLGTDASNEIGASSSSACRYGASSGATMPAIRILRSCVGAIACR